MTDEAKKLLLDVLTACQAIERFAAGRSFAEYQKDEAEKLLGESAPE